MKIDITKIKPCDKVKYGNEWYLVHSVQPPFVVIFDEPPSEHLDYVQNITDHKPAHATQPVGEWFTNKQWESLIGDDMYLKRKHVVDFLQKEYGHPPMNQVVHTYNGEPASEWGLRFDDSVLWYDPANFEWSSADYCDLTDGDRWMMQPPAPKGGAE